MKKYSLILMIFIQMIPTLTFGQNPNINWQEFETYVNKALTDWGIPGLSVSVVKDDKVLFAKGFGVKESGRKDKNDAQTIFGVASNSKAFTATALAILVDEGKIRWDDKVSEYLPEFQLYDPFVTRELTIRDLLTHRNGLPAYGGDILWWGGNYKRREIIERARFIKPRFSFRSTYAYQNIPYIAAGEIIAQVTGKSWEEFVKERILKPLKMNSTTTGIKEFTDKTNKTTPHFWDIEKQKLIPVKWRDLENGVAAAGLNSNVIDMANWLRLQIGQGEFEGKRIVSARQMQIMQAPQIQIPFMQSPNPKLKTNFRAYGFGWNIREYAGEKMVGHGGWTDGQLSQSVFLPDQKLGVVVLTNIHNREIAFALIYRVFDMFLKKPKTDWSAFFLNEVKKIETAKLDNLKTLENERNKTTTPRLALKEYAGTYQNELYGKVEFVEEKGKLVVKLTNSPTFIGDLEHWQYETFQVIWRDPVAEKTFLTFKLKSSGKVESVKMAMTDFIDDTEYEYFKVK